MSGSNRWTRRLVIGALCAAALLWIPARYACTRWLDIRGPIPCDRFQIEVTALGYESRCKWHEAHIEASSPRDSQKQRIVYFPEPECVGDVLLPAVWDSAGTPVALGVPCTTLRPRVRVWCREELSYNEQVESECPEGDLCIHRRQL